MVSILRESKKQYYSKLLENNRNNIKGTWKVINKIIKKKGGNVELPNYFTKNLNETINNRKEVADEFN